MAQKSSQTRGAKKKTPAKASERSRSNGSSAPSGAGAGGKKNSASDKTAAVVSAVAGIFLALLALIPGGQASLWEGVKGVYYGIFGISGLVLPFLLIIGAVLITVGSDKSTGILKLVDALVVSVLIGTMINIFQTPQADIDAGLSVGDRAAAAFTAYSSGKGIGSSGLPGAVIGSLLIKLSGSKAPAYAVTAVLIALLTAAFFGMTISGIVERVRARREYEKSPERTAQKEELEREREARRKAEREARAERKRLEEEERRRRAEAEAERIKQAQRVSDEELEKRRREEQEREKGRDLGRQVIDEILDEDEKNRRRAKAEPDGTDAQPREPDIFTKAKKARRGKGGEVITATLADDDVPEAGQADPDEPPVVTDRDDDDMPRIEDASGFMPGSGSGAPALTPEEAAKAAAELARRQGIEKDEPAPEKGAAEFEAPDTEKPKIEYIKPSPALLRDPPPASEGTSREELITTGEKLIGALEEYGVKAKVSAIVPGASVTRYELTPAPGVKISKFTGLADDLTMRLAAPAALRIEAPIPNKAAIGVEIPNRNRRTIVFKEVLEDPSYKEMVDKKGKLVVALGKDIAGSGVFCDLSAMPHLLVAGTTGSGKSVCLTTMIFSLLYNATPEEVRIILIDPKKVEFSKYNGIAHLLVPVVSDPRKAAGALGWAVTEMLRRYQILDNNGVKDLNSYNKLAKSDPSLGLEPIPRIVIFIDELADLMLVAANEVEQSILRLAQMARAAGMHLVIATQRPSVDVITGVIKSNIPSRIALSVSSQTDSRTILDQGGAEKLMGYGDMLYFPVGKSKPLRLQGAYVADDELDAVIGFIKQQSDGSYSREAEEEIERQAVPDKKAAADDGDSGGGKRSGDDELFMQAVEFCVMNPEKVSISGFQRKLGMGFAKAGRLMDILEQRGVVGPAEGSKPRKVLITRQQWYEMNNGSSGPYQGNPADE